MPLRTAPDRVARNPKPKDLEADLRAVKRALMPARGPCGPRGTGMGAAAEFAPDWHRGHLGLAIRANIGLSTLIPRDPALQLMAPVARQLSDRATRSALTP